MDHLGLCASADTDKYVASLVMEMLERKFEYDTDKKNEESQFQVKDKKWPKCGYTKLEEQSDGAYLLVGVKVHNVSSYVWKPDADFSMLALFDKHKDEGIEVKMLEDGKKGEILEWYEDCRESLKLQNKRSENLEEIRKAVARRKIKKKTWAERMYELENPDDVVGHLVTKGRYDESCLYMVSGASQLRGRLTLRYCHRTSYDIVSEQTVLEYWKCSDLRPVTHGNKNREKYVRRYSKTKEASIPSLKFSDWEQRR